MIIDNQLKICSSVIDGSLVGQSGDFISIPRRSLVTCCATLVSGSAENVRVFLERSQNGINWIMTDHEIFIGRSSNFRCQFRMMRAVITVSEGAPCQVRAIVTARSI